MKIVQSWKRNYPTTDAQYGLTITYIYSSNCLSEIERIEKSLPKGILVMDTDKPQRLFPLESRKERDQ